jgi:hypothetical protein
VASPKSFAARMKTLGKAVQTNSQAAIIRTAAAVNQAVIIATPVDTGRARNNWQVDLGQAPTSELEPEDRSGQAAISRNNETIQARQPGQDIYISNNVQYIQRLNDGWSAQAPENFVEKAVQVGIQHIKEAKLLKG